jgi:hypothetical protein
MRLNELPRSDQIEDRRGDGWVVFPWATLAVSALAPSSSSVSLVERWVSIHST